MGYGLRVKSCGLWVTGYYGLQVMGYGLRVTGYGLRVTGLRFGLSEGGGITAYGLGV